MIFFAFIKPTTRVIIFAKSAMALALKGALGNKFQTVAYDSSGHTQHSIYTAKSLKPGLDCTESLRYSESWQVCHALDML